MDVLFIWLNYIHEGDVGDTTLGNGMGWCYIARTMLLTTLGREQTRLKLSGVIESLT